MPAHTKTTPALATELEAITAAAADWHRARAARNPHERLDLQQRWFAHAASAALDGGVTLGAIANAEHWQHKRPRQEPGRELLMRMECPARAHGSVGVVIERAERSTNT